MKNLLFFLITCLFSNIILSSNLIASKKQPAFRCILEYAYAQPKGDMSNYFNDGQGGRIDLFTGIKLPNVKYISAVGLALDFTYIKFESKNGNDRYDLFQWDWFKLPIPSIFIFDFNAGLFWNVMNVKLTDYGYKQLSIRPGFYIQGGLHIPLFQKYVQLKGDVRYGWMYRDLEKMPDGSGKELNLDMNFVTYYGGIMINF